MLTVVVPEVAVTVIAAGPVGVPGEAGFGVGPEPELTEPHPTITAARANAATHMLNAMRRRGASWDRAKAAAKNEDSSMPRPSNPSGLDCGQGGTKIDPEDAASVENVNWTIVPFGGEAGVTEFDPNAQLEFAGAPEQLRVN